MLTRQERIQGGLLGLLIGDALGVPYEFHPAAAIPALPEIDYVPPEGFHRSYPDVLPGTWSDDGAQALCLLDSLLHCQRLDPDNFAQRMLKWYSHGYLAVDEYRFDVGIHTARVMEAIRDGIPVLEAGALGHQARGNGSLMRSLPLALWHQGTDAELVVDAHLQSQVTHGDRYCQVCCALYCLWARRVLEADEFAWVSAVTTLRQLYADNAPALEVLELEIRPDQPPTGTGSGYVIDCLNSARLALEFESYEQVVKAAIALGNDTDTTACVAGGIAGLRDGAGAIPAEWRAHLRGQDILNPLMMKLLQL
jgi:ADP-ribosyl-[dinitrogen reductase] hydrolase